MQTIFKDCLLVISQKNLGKKNVVIISEYAYPIVHFSEMCVLSYVQLCDLMDGSLPGSSAHGILKARILEWVAMFSSRGSSWPRDWTQVFCISCTDRQILYQWHHLESPYWNFIVVKIESKTSKYYLTFCNSKTNDCIKYLLIRLWGIQEITFYCF